jgi:hypothetical protein
VQSPALAQWVDREIPGHDPLVSMVIAGYTVGALRL